MGKKIKEEGLWANRDWTVKVDIDAVFLPMRLRERLGQVEVTENGIYLENCKYVNFGFFGSLEVFSHNAAANYMANLDDCTTTLNYKGHEKNRKWRPDCATSFTPAIHHFKTPKEYFDCL